MPERKRRAERRTALEEWSHPTSFTITRDPADFRSSRGGAYSGLEVRFGPDVADELEAWSVQYLRTMRADVDVFVLPENAGAAWGITRPINFPGRFDEFVGRTGPDDGQFVASASDVDLLLPDGQMVPYKRAGIALDERAALATVHLSDPQPEDAGPADLRRYCVEVEPDESTLTRIRALLTRGGPLVRSSPVLPEELEAVLAAVLSQHGSVAVTLPPGTVRDPRRLERRYPGWLTIYQE